MRAKIVRVGNPVRSTLFRGDAERGLTMLGFVKEKPLLFVLGGSQGAREVNNLVLASLPLLCPSVQIVHQTGKANFDEVMASIPDDDNIRASYRPLPYLGAEIADIYAASTIVAGRAGAGTVWEAASLGKPMILIPLSGPGTRGDQVENAALAAQAGAATVLEGAQISPPAFANAVKNICNVRYTIPRSGPAIRLRVSRLRLPRPSSATETPPTRTRCSRQNSLPACS